jgi:hypothetical protein
MPLTPADTYFCELLYSGEDAPQAYCTAYGPCDSPRVEAAKKRLEPEIQEFLSLLYRSETINTAEALALLSKTAKHADRDADRNKATELILKAHKAFDPGAADELTAALSKAGDTEGAIRVLTATHYGKVS